MSEPQPPQGNKFNAFVKKSVDKASSALKFLPFDKKENEDEVLINKKDHRRAQVRKAQIEHRQRKENHIKALEEEIAGLREMIDDAENQSRLFKLENEAIKQVLKTSNNPALLNIPGSSENSQQFTPITTQTPYGSEEPPISHPDQQFFDSIASVNFDELMDVSYLQLMPGNDFGLPADTTMQFTEGHNNSLDLPTTDGTAQIAINPSNTNPDPAVSNSSFSANNDREIIEAMDASHKDPEVALKAINFILALEHPCRTHFLPTGTTPTPGLPVLPAHVPSGHEMMASTRLYAHAPPPVFKELHSKASKSAPSSSTPWIIPSSPTEELMKLYAMSYSLSKEDWEITPVQAWFLLVETLGIELLMREGVVENLKVELGKLVECFGFGATMNEGLFWAAVSEIDGRGCI